MALEDQFLWCEKYRPQSLEKCILPPGLRSTFQAFLDQGNVPNLLLAGGAGVGKTTVAKAVVRDLGCDWIVINGSLYGGIGTLRNDIQSYASTVSLAGGRKYVILDEADYLEKESTQPALRSFMENYADNAGFILTCNYPTRIIDALRSRCSFVDFKIEKKDRLGLLKQFTHRAQEILDAEKVPYDKESVMAFVVQRFPDFRRTVNELQKYAAHGRIDQGILAQRDVDNLDELVGFVKKKEYTKVTKWVADNRDIDFITFCRKFYESAAKHFAKEDIPRIVLVLADYQYKAAFVADQELNTLAMLTEVMLSTGQ